MLLFGKKMKLPFTLILFFLILSPYSYGNDRDKKKTPPKVIEPKWAKELDKEILKSILSEKVPLDIEQQDSTKKTLALADRYKHSPVEGLKLIPKEIPVSLRDNEIYLIKLGHSFDAVIRFVDKEGNPWSFQVLTEPSDTDVVSHLHLDQTLTVKPKAMAGQASLPIKLAGVDKPLMLLFKISFEEAYLTTTLIVDALGDHEKSQTKQIFSDINNNRSVAPKLSITPTHASLLKGITPIGYKELVLRNDYGQEVDDRDFMAWKNEGLIYLLTKYNYNTPRPIDISPSSDGVYKLYVFQDIPIITMNQNSQIIYLYVNEWGY